MCAACPRRARRRRRRHRSRWPTSRGLSATWPRRAARGRVVCASLDSGSWRSGPRRPSRTSSSASSTARCAWASRRASCSRPSPRRPASPPRRCDGPPSSRATSPPSPPSPWATARRPCRPRSRTCSVPLSLHLFDCLLAEGRSLLDEPYARRWEALERVTGGRRLAERAVISSAGEGEAFMARALAAGHEGVMAKELQSTYEPGGRGKRWFKLKTALTVDCVIVAADRGSGRRVGWLSNYHLAVRDGAGWAEVGKTFKGLTDREFTEMTERLRALATEDDGYTLMVRPDVVVEVEYNEIQKSPTYESGLALRFARIARLREDKSPAQASTIEELRHLYERQFTTKGRS